ncbi:MAG: hypothetical protein KF691_14790 [Phycisphaeraceae bacterium]|nr:hypothetical protein [Phycisphaeraceae bacterium]
MEITLANFESCAIPKEEYTHRAHLTVAYLYLRTHPLPEAINLMRSGILRFNKAKGVENTPSGGYHETLTVAWMRVIHSAMKTFGPLSGPEEFLTQHPHLLCVSLMRVFYSRARIMSAQARESWIEPDLATFPE